jgi:segregation and condensation protein A
MENQELKINIDNYTGPLDVLLDLAKAQKVDLTKISITHLADQFIEFIDKASKLNLDLASEYLLMATWLTYLKSKLLLPQHEEDEFKALEVAQKLKLQLKKLALIRLLSDQLFKKERLGIDIHMRVLEEP